ncbi:hypothetical protein EYC80_006137 [Monilinia laxa]|uniref:Expansin-like EG45 domain-containing protein n=1 Tax=Monilinia laxa TaxID=61186 RepID=A0A5N6KGG9_MONLA|nr:hypothetical protein EYC80_006137 [Monilinia laxa]
MFFSIKSLAVAAGILSVAQGAALAERANSGKASTYGGNTQGGACSFSTYTLPSGVFGTALSSAFWDGSANCGRCVSITGPKGNKITAMITDLCPGGCAGYHLDLYTNAFTTLGSLSQGVLDVTWDYVKCPITTPLQLHNKEGVSQWWFSIQVVNAAEGVSKVEVSTNGGSTWQPTTRKDYNFFENPSGFGTAKVDVKVTGISGSTVVVKNVAVTANSIFTASGNLGSNDAAVAPASSSPVAEPSTATSPAITTPSSSSAILPSTSAAPTTLVSVPVSSSVPEVPTSAPVVLPSTTAAPSSVEPVTTHDTPSTFAYTSEAVPTQSVVWVDSDECDSSE